MRLLVPSDGSPPSIAAVRYAIRFMKEHAGTELHLLNIQAPVSGTASGFVGGRAVRDYHKEEGAEQLKPAREALDAAGVAYECHIGVGQPGTAIAAYADERQCEQIIMGTSGAGGWKKLLGSTATDVLRSAKMPVTLVK